MSAFSKIGRTLAAGLMTATLAGPALASDNVDYPDAAEAAQAKADAARTRATKLEAQGAWGYKTGSIERANQDATKYQDQANAIRAEESGVPAPPPPDSAELTAAKDRLETLQDQGGWAYKSGAVRRAEADVRAVSEPTATTPSIPTEQDNKPAIPEKPVEGTESLPPSE